MNCTAKNIMYKYFERESTKTKSRMSPKLRYKTADATGYCEPIVRRIVAGKSALSGAAFSSPAKLFVGSYAYARMFVSMFCTHSCPYVSLTVVCMSELSLSRMLFSELSL